MAIPPDALSAAAISDDETALRGRFVAGRRPRAGDRYYDPNAPLPSIPHPPSAYDRLDPQQREAVNRMVVGARLAIMKGAL